MSPIIAPGSGPIPWVESLLQHCTPTLLAPKPVPAEAQSGGRAETNRTLNAGSGRGEDPGAQASPSATCRLLPDGPHLPPHTARSGGRDRTLGLVACPCLLVPRLSSFHHRPSRFSSSPCRHAAGSFRFWLPYSRAPAAVSFFWLPLQSLLTTHSAHHRHASLHITPSLSEQHWGMV